MKPHKNTNNATHIRDQIRDNAAAQVDRWVSVSCFMFLMSLGRISTKVTDESIVML
jgi:hypothetical protein